jgi:RNA polymerase sigma-70 factor (ECF subfamily)
VIESGSEFRVLMDRVRAGDEAAAETLVRAYEPEIRRIVRVRLNNSKMRKLVDSVDICQSVLANFFVRAALGQFELDSPQKLLKLLATMACNKFNDQIRKQRADKRGQGKDAVNDTQVLRGLEASEPGPAKLAALREILEIVRSHLTPEERYLVEHRLQGREWASLGAELKMTPDAVRKRFTRALDRVTQQMKLEGIENVD